MPSEIREQLRQQITCSIFGDCHIHSLAGHHVLVERSNYGSLWHCKEPGANSWIHDSDNLEDVDAAATEWLVDQVLNESGANHAE